MQNSNIASSGHKHGHSQSHSASHVHSHSKNRGDKRKAQRVQRACSNCRKRKQGCEEERPCRRCVEKGIDCQEVEPKRKRGRAKSQTSNSKIRSDSQSGDEMADYDEDEAEDFYSEEEDSFSEEDHIAISPRESPLTAGVPATNKNNFKLGESNTSSASNLHTVLSHSLSMTSTPTHSNSNVQPLSRCNSSVAASMEKRTDQIDDPSRPRSGSNLSDVLPDSPNNADIDQKDDLAEVDSQEQYQHEEQQHTDSNVQNFFDCTVDENTKKNGLNLAFLLPFIGNLSSSNDDDPMFIDDDYDISSNSTYNPFASQQTFETVLQNKLWNSDLPFNTSNQIRSGHYPAYLPIEEGDSKALVYIKECWEEFQSKNRDIFNPNSNIDGDLQRLRECWKETMKSLRNLEWQKVQSLLREMETLPMNTFGGHTQPSMVFWSSGGRIHHANESFCKLVGYTEEELRLEVSLDMSLNSPYPANAWPQGYTMKAHTIFHPDEMMKLLKRQLEAVSNPEKSSYQMNTRLLGKYRQEIPVSCSILNIRDASGPSLLTVAIFV